MGDVLKFKPNPEDRNKKNQPHNPNSAFQTEAIRRMVGDAVKRAEEASGAKVLINLENFFAAQAELPPLIGQIPQAAQGRNRELYAATISTMDRDELLTLFNGSNELQWKERPVYWQMVIDKILEKGFGKDGK